MTAPRVTAQEAIARIKEGHPVVFIDSRAPEAWGRSNEQLPGAVRAPLGRFDASVAAVPRDRVAIAYCT